MLRIDKYNGTPIYEQIIEGIEREVLLGLLCEGDAIPSVRELSVVVGINPNTIQRAYLELERRGVTVALLGRGSFVREGALDSIRQRTKRKLNEVYALARELKLAGVDSHELYEMIERAYSTEEVEK